MNGLLPCAPPASALTPRGDRSVFEVVIVSEVDSTCGELAQQLVRGVDRDPRDLVAAEERMPVDRGAGLGEPIAQDLGDAVRQQLVAPAVRQHYRHAGERR